MPSDREYADLSAAVYGTTAPPGWSQLTSLAKNGGFYAAAFRNDVTGEVVVAFRGTEYFDSADWRADTRIVFGAEMPQQFHDGLAFAKTVSATHGVPITLTGHSLGGSIAQYVTAQTGAPAVTFAAPGIGHMSDFSFGPEGTADVRNLVTSADPVSVFGRHIGTVETTRELPGALAAMAAVAVPGLAAVINRFGVFYLFHRIEGYSSYFASAVAAPSPIALDLDGDGVETRSPANGAWFDHAGDRFAEQTGWVAPDDGLLALDRNSNGEIDGGAELFGDHTRLRDGTLAANGYAALADLDDNRDGQLDSRDQQFASLRIWQDTDGDGLSAPGELRSLPSLGVASIETSFHAGTGADAQGNDHRQVGTFRRVDGTAGATADVWFASDPRRSFALDRIVVPEGITALPDLPGSGVVADLHQVMAREPDGSLASLVADFGSEPDPGARARIVDAILIRWSGSDGVVAGSRGPYADARQLTMLERFVGRPFVGSWGSDPGPGAVEPLTLAYEALREATYAQLMVQTHLRGVSELVTFEWDDEREGLRMNLDAAGAELERRLDANPAEGQAVLSEFGRALRGLVPVTAPEYLDLRDRFASDPQLIWLMDSAGKAIDGRLDGQPVPGSWAWRGTVGADVLVGGLGMDALHGAEGGDALSGAPGDDILDGGAGWDTLAGDDGDDALLGGSGSDVLQGGAGADALRGGDEDDSLDGGDGDDVLDGGPGSDRLDGGSGRDRYLFGRGSGRDVFFDTGGAGDDTIVMKPDVAPGDVIIHGYGGDVYVAIAATGDEVHIPWQIAGTALPEIRFANGLVLDAAAISAAAALPSELADQLWGTDGNDVIAALGGNDHVIGGWGNDRIEGGAGNDLLSGQDGADLIDGGPGADVMFGGRGDDVFVVDDPGDVPREWPSEGTDTVQSSISYLLGADLENLVLTGAAAIDGTGNAGRNTLMGNGAGNVLDGGGGADTMRGGAGDDTYLVDVAGDIVAELPGEGNDTVRSSANYRLSAEIERLELMGTGAIDGTGNALANDLLGNAGSNRLDGGTGADTMRGGAGNDTYVVDHAGDVVTELAGNGTDAVLSSIAYRLPANVENGAVTGSKALALTGNELANVLTGNAGANVLDGDAGADRMVGGKGNDTYVVDQAGDVVTELSGAGTDTVLSAISYTLPANVEHLTLTGTAPRSATGNELANTLTGNEAPNTVDGRAGNDVLAGGKGGDTYLFRRGSGLDVIKENDPLPDVDTVRAVGIAPIDLVPARRSGDLVLSVRGGTDEISVKSWYLGQAYRVEVIEAGDGRRLPGDGVEALIQAMAAFGASMGVTWTQAVEQRPADAQILLAQHWQAPAA
jgi:Ca2+-binding RTX toxin-like protein